MQHMVRHLVCRAYHTITGHRAAAAMVWTVAGLAFGAFGIDVGDDLLVNGGFETGSNDPGWTGGGVNDKDGAYKPQATFIGGKYVGIIQMSSYKQQVFTNDCSVKATLSWRYIHRTSYNSNVPMYYTVWLDGEVIRAEEKIADTTARSASIEDIELAVGEHTLKFQGRTDNNADSTFFIDDISLTVTRAATFTVDEPEPVVVTGFEVRPKPVVKDLEGGTLTETTDYTLDYADNVLPGRGKVIVTGCGSQTGVVEAAFTILASAPTLPL